MISSSLSNDENNYYSKYLKNCGGENLEFYSFKDEVNIIHFKKLDLSCLEKEFLNHLKNFPVESWSSSGSVIFDENIIRSRNKNNADIPYELIKITSLFSQKCGENCVFSDEVILSQNNNYWYIRGFNDKGVEARFVSKDAINIQNLMSTHTRNYIFDKNKNKIANLPNGILEFNNDYILVKSQKSYFKEMGAFWFDSKIKYSGEIIELISNGNTCKNGKSFNEKILNAMNKQQLKEFCVTTKY